MLRPVNLKFDLGLTLSPKFALGLLTAICRTGPSCTSNISHCQYTTVVVFCTASLARDHEKQRCRPDSLADSYFESFRTYFNSII